MQKALRPVSIGLLLGFISLLFGISWAMYITVNHDRIQTTLAGRARVALADKFVMSSSAHSHDVQNMKNMGDMKDMPQSSEGAGAKDVMDQKPGNGGEDSSVDEAWERLRKGHLHAMGLGTITLVVSFLIAFLGAPPRIKTLASAGIGVGGLFYPMAWIIMGYRTPVLGAEAAAESVLPITAFSMLLVLAGIIITIFYLLRAVITGE
jgi:hypothetical protein